MSGRIYYSDHIEDDLTEICRYIAERNLEAASRLLDELLAKIRLIGNNPTIGSNRDYLMQGVRLFPHGNYNIYYSLREDGVEIYRVLHSSRDEIQVFADAID